MRLAEISRPNLPGDTPFLGVPLRAIFLIMAFYQKAVILGLWSIPVGKCMSSAYTVCKPISVFKELIVITVSRVLLIGVALSFVGLLAVFHTNLAPIDTPIGQAIAVVSFLVVAACSFMSVYLELNRISEVRALCWQDHLFILLFYFSGITLLITLLIIFQNIIWLLALIFVLGPSTRVIKLRQRYLTWVRRLYT